MKSLLPILMLAAACAAAPAAKPAAPAPKPAKPIVVCPLKPDPPPVIDGDPREWANLPGAIAIGDKHVTWGRHNYTGEDDISGTVRLCYDANYLYLLVEVVDDKLVTSSGRGMFNADHIELDFTADYRPAATGPHKGGKLRIIGFNPGSVDPTGDPVTDVEPEPCLVSPPGINWSGIDVGSSITEDGYILEARIPWKVLGVTKPVAIGMVFGVDVHLSDSDSGKMQETMSSINFTTPWKGRQQENILQMVLTGTDGKIPPKK